MDKTKVKKQKLLEALFDCNGVVTAACEIVGISRQTYYKYYDQDEEFKQSVDELGDVALDFAESQLFKQIQEGSTAATIFYLKTKGKKRGYIERQEVNHSGQIDNRSEEEILESIDQKYARVQKYRNKS